MTLLYMIVYYAPLVQWLACILPVAVIRVRVPGGAFNNFLNTKYI